MKLIRFGEPGKEKPGILNKQSKRKNVSSLKIGTITVNRFASAVIKTKMNGNIAPEQLAYMSAKIRWQIGNFRRRCFNGFVDRI